LGDHHDCRAGGQRQPCVVVSERIRVLGLWCRVLCSKHMYMQSFLTR
jgi:hypothetical protein